MKYRDLKDERDAAVARMLEAERLSMKSEFDRVTAEFEQEKAKLRAQISDDVASAYQRGFNDGKDAMANDITARLTYRGALKPPSEVQRWQAAVGVDAEVIHMDADTKEAARKFQEEARR